MISAQFNPADVTRCKLNKGVNTRGGVAVFELEIIEGNCHLDLIHDVTPVLEHLS